MPSAVDLTQVGVVILNWNGLVQTRTCLASFGQLPQLPAKIIVIDNGSTPAQDQSLRELRSLAITVVRSEKNLGFAGGMNLGIQTILEDKDIQYVLLLNNDTVLTPHSLEELLKSMKQSDVGLVGARMVRMHHPDQIENRGLGISSWGLAWNITQPAITPSLAGGGCLLIRRELIQQLQSQGQVFDEKLFLYFEDVDLGLRARALGWQGVTCDEAVVQHTGGGSSQQTPDIPLYYWHRNSLWVVIKNFPTTTLLMNLFPMIMLHIAVSVLYTCKGKGRVVWKAKWDAVKGLPEVLRQRQKRDPKLSYSEFRSLKYSNFTALRAWKGSLEF